MAESDFDRSPPALSPEHHKEELWSSLDQVMAPNVFERVKEEIEALVQTINHKDETAATQSKGDKNEFLSESTAKAAKVIEIAKGEIEKMLHINISKETHGQRDDIGEDTPLNEVKAPNLFERAVEEYEALMQTIHSKKESQACDKRDETANAASMEKEVAPPSEISSNEEISIKEVKVTNIFERAEDEVEALIHTINQKKETDSPGKEGFLSKLGKCLEGICSPSKDKDD